MIPRPVVDVVVDVVVVVISVHVKLKLVEKAKSAQRLAPKPIVYFRVPKQ